VEAALSEFPRWIAKIRQFGMLNKPVIKWECGLKVAGLEGFCGRGAFPTSNAKGALYKEPWLTLGYVGLHSQDLHAHHTQRSSLVVINMIDQANQDPAKYVSRSSRIAFQEPIKTACYRFHKKLIEILSHRALPPGRVSSR